MGLLIGGGMYYRWGHGMFVSSIIERELRVALRKHRAVKSRFKAAGIGAAIVCGFLLLGLLIGSFNAGRTLHRVLFFMGLALAVVPPARISVGLFCEERRNQTLQLLYLTGMGAAELFVGKLLGGVVMASNDLLAITPLLAVPFFSGGVSVNLFLATVACLPVVLLFTVAIGVLASVWCRDDGAAMVCAVVVGVVICLAVPLPYYLGRAISGFAPFPGRWLCLSPAYGPFLVGTNFSGATPRDFWITAGVTCLWTLACLTLAAVWLSKHWRQDEVRSVEVAGWRGKWARWVHGSAEWRLELRERLLAKNAFQWLAQQDRRPVFLAWGFMGAVVGLWLLGWAAWPRYWASPMNFYLTAFVLLGGMGMIMSYAAARAIGNERREGSLELLLTTPLRPAEIVAGQVAATRDQFRPVRLALTGLFVVMMAGGFLTRPWTQTAFFSYVVIWVLFLLSSARIDLQKVPLAMWAGLNTGRPMMAVFRSRADGKRQRWWWIYFVLNGSNLWRGLSRAGGFPSGSYGEVFIVGLVAVLVLIYVVVRAIKPAAQPLRERLIAEMRLIARLPLPDLNDPKFKQWMSRKQPPMAAYVQTYPERMAGRMGRGLGRRWGQWQVRRRMK